MDAGVQSITYQKNISNYWSTKTGLSRLPYVMGSVTLAADCLGTI